MAGEMSEYVSVSVSMPLAWELVWPCVLARDRGAAAPHQVEILRQSSLWYL